MPFILAFPVLAIGAKAVGIAGISANTQLGVIAGGLALKGIQKLAKANPEEGDPVPEKPVGEGHLISKGDVIDGDFEVFSNEAETAYSKSESGVIVAERPIKTRHQKSARRSTELGFIDIHEVGEDNYPGFLVTGENGREIWVPQTAEELWDIAAAARIARRYGPEGILFMPNGRTA